MTFFHIKISHNSILDLFSIASFSVEPWLWHRGRAAHVDVIAILAPFMNS